MMHNLLCFLFSLSVVKKERQPPSPDDVIVLSDNEPSSPVMNGHCITKTDTDKLMVGKQLFKISMQHSVVNPLVFTVTLFLE